LSWKLGKEGVEDEGEVVVPMVRMKHVGIYIYIYIYIYIGEGVGGLEI